MNQKTENKRVVGHLEKNISKALKKQKSRASVKSIILYCVPCTRSYTIITKDDKGEMIEQQVCQHTIFKKVLIK